MHVSRSTETAVRKSNLSVLPDQLVRLSRGFSCIFWSIPLCLLLFTSTPDFTLSPKFRVPSFLLGLMVFYAGAFLLQHAGPLSERWGILVRRTLLMILLELYLAPFLYWWKRMPFQPYYMVNALLFFMILVWGLFLVHQLAGELARLLHSASLELETLLYRWVVLCFMAILPLTILFEALRRAWQDEGPALPQLIHMALRLPRWTLIPLLLPFTITMSIAWKAKERCFSALKISAKVPALGTAEQEDPDAGIRES